MQANAQPSGDSRADGVRSCKHCSEAAVRVYHVTRHYVNAIPAGRTYEHRCQACGAQFRTLSTWRTIRELFFIALMGPMGLLLAVIGVADLSRSWWAALLGLVFLAFGGWLVFATGKALLALTQNPSA